MRKLCFVMLLPLMALGFVPKSFSTEYKQIVQNQLNGKKRITTGQFDYQYPGKLYLIQGGEESLTYVTNNSKTWMLKAPFLPTDKPEVIIHKGQDKSLTNFLDILKAGLKNNKKYKVAQDKSSATLSFSTKVVEQLGIVEAKLIFVGRKLFKDLVKIDIRYTDGRVVEFELRKINTLVKFTQEHFVLPIPKNANVINQ